MDHLLIAVPVFLKGFLNHDEIRQVKNDHVGNMHRRLESVGGEMRYLVTAF